MVLTFALMLGTPIDKIEMMFHDFLLTSADILITNNMRPWYLLKPAYDCLVGINGQQPVASYFICDFLEEDIIFM